MRMRARSLAADRRLVPRAFDRAAARYDLLTSMNPGYDEHLRLSAARMHAPGNRVLDLCCGTGRSTQAVLTVQPAATVVAVDASMGMLQRFAPCAPRVQGDAAAVPLSAASVDAAFVAYGVRNAGDPDACLRELFRVIRPGGRLAVHEYALTDTRSRITWTAVAHLVIIPAGWLATRDAGLYRYLHRSVVRFDRAPELVARIQRAGFTDVERHDTSHWQKGITHTFTATRP